MIEINLLPEEFRRKETVRITLPEIPIKRIVIIAGSVIVGLQLLLAAWVFYSQFETARLKKTIGSLKKETASIAHEKAEMQSIQARLKDIQALTDRKFYWSSLLSALSNSMSKGVWLRTLSVTEEFVMVSKPAPKKSEAKTEETNSKKSKDKEKSKEKEKLSKEKNKKEESDKKSKKEKEEPKPPVKVNQPRWVLKLEGSVVGTGQETAFVGLFLKQLKSNALFNDLFSDIELSNMSQRKVKEFDVYDFVVIGKFKQGKL